MFSGVLILLAVALGIVGVVEILLSYVAAFALMAGLRRIKLRVAALPPERHKLWRRRMFRLLGAPGLLLVVVGVVYPVLCMPTVVPSSSFSGRSSEGTLGEDLEKPVSNAVKPLVVSPIVTAVVVGIVNGDETAVRGYGSTAFAGGRAPDGDTVFEIGSITKTFTSSLLVCMAEEGLVKPEDPLSAYLPDPAVAPSFNGAPILLEHLATHTAGFPTIPEKLAKWSIYVSATLPSDPYESMTVEQVLGCLPGYRLTQAPGKNYEYSNYGVMLLGYALCRKAGQGYEEALRQRVLGPLDMKDTAVEMSESQRKRMAEPYAAVESWGDYSLVIAAENWDFAPGLEGPGALKSTVNDLLKYVKANIGDGSELSKVLAKAHEPRHEAIPHYMQLGLGWHIFEDFGGTKKSVLWHNGGTGGYTSFLGFNKETRTGVVVLTNGSCLTLLSQAVDICGKDILLALMKAREE